MGVVKFAEETIGRTLNPYEKLSVEEWYKVIKDNGPVYYIPSRGRSRMGWSFLVVLYLTFYEKERSAVNGESIICDG